MTEKCKQSCSFHATFAAVHAAKAINLSVMKTLIRVQGMENKALFESSKSIVSKTVVLLMELNFYNSRFNWKGF